MPTLPPRDALVRPRVRGGDGQVCLLEDLVAESMQHGTKGVFWVVGGPGSGKTTAAHHLQQRFPDLIVLDEPHLPDAVEQGEANLVIATSGMKLSRRWRRWQVLPWSRDDLVEYLLNAHPEQCKDIMARLGSHAGGMWLPELASIVLEHFAADQTLDDPMQALLAEVRDRAGSQDALATAMKTCLTMLCEQKTWVFNWMTLFEREASPELQSLLRHRSVQVPMAAEYIVTSPSTRHLSRRLVATLPTELLDYTAQRFQSYGKSLEFLPELIDSGRWMTTDPMAASLRIRIDPSWRPTPEIRKPWNLSRGSFPRAQWSEVHLADVKLNQCDLREAELVGADLSNSRLMAAMLEAANLAGVQLSQAQATQASFAHAKLAGAHCSAANFSRADFHEADLRDADLSSATLSNAVLSHANLSHANLKATRLTGANLEEANLVGADLSGAQLEHVDLRTAALDDTKFNRANLSHAQLEDVNIQHGSFYQANLANAHLTGSQMPGVDFCQARLVDTHLAEVNWEGADLRRANLRGASFHMGTSRSGMIHSPIAREGSMTGFYTDDRTELHYKRPEHIRKANLRGAKLRGAQVDGVDFYLVDLRDAELDPPIEHQARQTGAILEDFDYDE